MTHISKRLGRGLTDLAVPTPFPPSGSIREGLGRVGKGWEESGKDRVQSVHDCPRPGKDQGNQWPRLSTTWERLVTDQFDAETLDHGRSFVEYMQLSGGSGAWEGSELYEQYEWWCRKVSGRVALAENVFYATLSALGIVGHRLSRSVSKHRWMARTIPERRER